MKKRVWVVLLFYVFSSFGSESDAKSFLEKFNEQVGSIDPMGNPQDRETILKLNKEQISILYEQAKAGNNNVECLISISSDEEEDDEKKDPTYKPPYKPGRSESKRRKTAREGKEKSKSNSLLFTEDFYQQRYEKLSNERDEFKQELNSKKIDKKERDLYVLISKTYESLSFEQQYKTLILNIEITIDLLKKNNVDSNSLETILHENQKYQFSSPDNL